MQVLELYHYLTDQLLEGKKAEGILITLFFELSFASSIWSWKSSQFYVV
jgi:hypothetical protein